MSENFGGIAELIEDFLTGKRKSVKYRYAEPDLPVHVLKKENDKLIYTLYWTNICTFWPYINSYSFHKRRILMLDNGGYRTATTRNAMCIFLSKLYWVGFIPKICDVFKYATLFVVDNKEFEFDNILRIYFWGRKSYRRKRNKLTGLNKEIILGKKELSNEETFLGEKEILIWVNDFFDKVGLEAFIGSLINRLPKFFHINKGPDWMIELAPYFIALIGLLKRKFLKSYFGD